MLLILQMWSTPKTKLSYCDQLDCVRFVMKARQDNDLIDHLGMFYTKNDIELTLPIRSGVDCDENQIGQLRDWSYRCDLRRKQNWVVVIDRT